MPSRKGCPNKNPSKYDGMSVAEYFRIQKQRSKDAERTVKKVMENYEH
jgi:hypothetical protein